MYFTRGRREDQSRLNIRKAEELLGLTRIRAIGASGEKLGVMKPTEALHLAREQGLDLVEVNPTASPPVCKILDLAKYRYEEAKKAAQTRRVPAPLVFLVRSKLAVKGRPGTFLVGDLVTGDAIRVGMVARIPYAADVFYTVPILSLEIVDHGADRTSDLGLHVVGDTPEEAAAIEAMEGPHLIEIAERPP